MILEATASYEQDGDCVIAEIFIFDPVEEVYHPEQVKEGTALLNFGTTSIGTIDFDKHYGNADGSIKVYFNHPANTQNLQLHVDTTLEYLSDPDDPASYTTAVYQKTVPVITSSSEDSIPLTQQPTEDSTTEYRSQRRIDENI